MLVKTLIKFATIFSLVFSAKIVIGQEAIPEYKNFLGSWIVNEELSDDTDKQVEIAIRAAGGKLPRTGKKGKGRYRGGPKEHEIYDHISYDDELDFQYSPPEFKLIYDDGFERTFHSDNRKRVVSASGTISGDNQDFSFASWENKQLLVETRARDGGWIFETLELSEDNLIITMEIKPSSFAEPINIKRVYIRPGKTL
jgi:hypothetical protein